MRLKIAYPITRYLLSTKPILATQGRFLGTLTVTTLRHSDHTRPFFTLDSKSVFQHLLHRTSMSSLARQNYAEECEAAVNRQINLELYASYVYMSMAYHFDRDDIALPGFHKFFKKQSEEEREHAEKLMKYQNMRGGRILLQDVRKPEVDEWGNGVEAMSSALKLEKSVNQSLLDLHKIAEGKNDVQLGDFLEGEFLKEQVESIKQISNYVTQLSRVGPGLGEYQFDKETLQESE